MTAAGDIFAGGCPRFYSIVSSRPFLLDLAAALHAHAGDDPLTLASTLIYLPTRRAVRALQDAFLTTAPGGCATLTPRIKALGDVDDDEFIAFAGEGEDETEIAPAISALERRMVLARLIAARERIFFDGQERWAGAVAAADELGKLLDSIYTEEVDPARLKDLAPERFAAHWAGSVDFLSIVLDAWPAYLAERARLDPAARRVALIDAQARRWASAPPSTPVVIAGTTGSAPAVARLMQAAAKAPRGAIVLPGLDLAASAGEWEAIDEPHPQSGLKALLETLKLDRKDIAPFPSSSGAPAPRARLLALTLRPAGATDDWREEARAFDTRENREEAFKGVSLVTADDEEGEAAAIAIKFRETVETPDKTAMLVTPDRDLARRVAMKMRRWNVIVDDSGGVPFGNSPCGTYLRLVAAWIADISNPVALGDMIRARFFGGGLASEARAHAIMALDRALRGLKPARGPEGLIRKVEESDEPRGERARNAARALVKTLCDAAAGLDGVTSFKERLEVHIAIAETLCAETGEAMRDNGAERLWGGDDGAVGADLMAGVIDHAGVISHDRAADYAAIFDQLIAGPVVRPAARAHPRLAILGPLEARLQTADTVILGGLNEGVWPRDAAIDPFLSRPMRAGLGLPLPERRIGLAAHDFAQLAASGEVMMTRAATSAGAPTKPSRWIVRLETILKSLGEIERLDASAAYSALARRLDAPAGFASAPAPAPAPPLAARPRRLSVTRIETLMRDPYAIYASKVLRLKKLDPPGRPAGRAELGQLLHKVFERYGAAPASAPTSAPQSVGAGEAALAALFTEEAARFGFSPADDAFYRAQITSALAWFAEWDAMRRRGGAPAIIEGTGEMSLDGPGGPFTLTARADRIDRREDGALAIVDFKTGALPSVKQSKTFSPQLALTGLIVEAGGFDEAPPPASVAEFFYARILARRGDADDDIGFAGEDASAAMGEAHKGLVELIAHFDNPQTTYPSQPRSEFLNQYGDYDHLARRRERAATGGEP